MDQVARPFLTIDFMTRFPALDGIRALGVLLIFALHYGGGVHSGRVLGLVNSVRLRGWMGVDLFFVLSGFLITGILYDTRLDTHYFRRFFARRSLRIFPVFYLVFAVLLSLTPFLQYKWRTGHLWFLAYLGNFALAVDPTLRQVLSANHPLAVGHLEHLWSLCIEEQFYLLWPLIVWKVRDRERLIQIALGLSCAALLFRVIFVVRRSAGLCLPHGFDQIAMLHMLPFRMDTLLLGATLALLLRGPSAHSWQQFCRRMVLPSVAVVVAICMLSPASDSPWLLTLGLSAIAIAGTALVGSALRQNSIPFRVFNLKLLRTLGQCSYGFYVYHVIWYGGFTFLVAALAARLHSSVLSNAIATMAVFAATFLVSLLSYHFFEARFLRLKRRFVYDFEATKDVSSRPIRPEAVE